MKRGFIRTAGRKDKTNALLLILILLTIIGILADIIVLREGWKSLFGWFS